MHHADATFADVTGTAVTATSANIVLERVEFLRSQELALDLESASATGASSAASAKAIDCSFEGNDFDIGVQDGATLFIDAPQQQQLERYVEGDPSSFGDVKPLKAAGQRFEELSTENEAFQALQQVRLPCSALCFQLPGLRTLGGLMRIPYSASMSGSSARQVLQPPPALHHASRIAHHASRIRTSTRRSNC